MRTFYLAFLGSTFGILTVLIFSNYLEKYKKRKSSNKVIDFKITDKTEIGIFRVELDKIIDDFIKNSRETFAYSEDRLLQKLCIDLFHLKTILTDEEKKEVVRDIMLNENSEYDVDNELSYFIKLINRYKDRINSYEKDKLENDFNEIKINNFNNFVIDLDNEIKNSKTINHEIKEKLADNLIFLKDILTDNEKIAARDEIVNKYDLRNRIYFFIKLVDENLERIVKYKNEINN